MKHRTVILKDAGTQQRAYSLLSIKSLDDDKRVITGIATTPTPDRYGDIVEPKGAQFKLPLPFLWQHDASQPIGHVTKAKVTKDGIEVTIELAKLDDPGRLKDRLDEAWQAIKAGLVRGLSIGFTSIESTQIDGSWSRRFVLWEWLELSAVTIPANAESTIQSIKSIDTTLRASMRRVVKLEQTTETVETIDATRRATSGPLVEKARGVVRLGSPPPDIPGASSDKTSKPIEPLEGKQMNVQETIKAFETQRKAKADRMDAIMAKSAEKGETLDAAEEEEYDGLKDEVAVIDKHLERLREHEKAVAARAVAIPTAKQIEKATPSEVAEFGKAARRGDGVIAVEKKLPPGVAFARLCGVMARAKGSMSDALLIAKEVFPEEKMLHAVLGMHGRIKEDIETGRVMKAATDIGITTDSDYAAPLIHYQYIVNDFIDFLRPDTILGRIPGLREVPFNVSVPRVLTGGSASWVGEAKPKPVTSITLDSVTLNWKKLATIAVISQELARFSQPKADLMIRDILKGAVVQQMDSDFVNPANAGTANVKPASIFYGVTPIASGGDTEAEVRHDVYNILAAFRTANLSTGDAVWLMSEQNADGLALLTNALGQPAFPSMDSETPTFRRRPVITSQAMGSYVGLIKASEILVADDGQVTIDSSSEASVQMDSAPDDPSTASTVMISLWQRNLLGIKAERYIDWVKARSTSAQLLSGVEWGMETT